MSTRKGGLGKGLSSLIPSEPTDAEGGPYRELDIDSVAPNPNQPRSRFDAESLSALSASVAEVGVIQPVIVRPAADGSYELIAGERRWRAAKRAGLRTIPALVRSADPVGSLETAVIENLHRQDLNPLEEAAAYSQLIEDFKLSQKAVAKRVGRSRSAVANTIRLLQLPAGVQRLLADGRLSAGHGRALLSVSDPAASEPLAKRAVEDGWSVRHLEEMLSGKHVSGDGLTEHLARSPAADKDKRSAGTAAARSRPAQQTGVLELENLLASRLDTTVKIQLGKGTGKLVVSFADLDDLERIYRIITPHGTDA